MSLIEVVLFLSFMLISHFIVTAWIYSDVKRQDKGLDPKPETCFSEHIFPCIMFFPLLMHEIFEYTFGCFSRLLRERVSEKAVRAEDKIARLQKENEDLKSRLKASSDEWLHVFEVINESEDLKNTKFRLKSRDDFWRWYYIFRKDCR